jgi:hypothetical protein
MSRKGKNIHSPNPWKLISAVLFVLLLVPGSVILYDRRPKQSPDKTNLYVKELSKLMVLPKDVPVLTVIDDPAKFLERDPLFFKPATSGDVLLAFRDRAIIYDPKIKKILNIASVFTIPPPLPLTPLRISLRYNGKDEQRAMALKSQLESVSPNYQVAEVVPSQVIYEGDVVYLVNPNREEDVIYLAKGLGNSPLVKNPDKKDTMLAPVDVIVAFRNTSRL